MKGTDALRSYALRTTVAKKKALQSIISDFREYCMEYNVESAEFRVDHGNFILLRTLARENDLIFEHYKNKKGYRVLIMTRDVFALTE